MARLIRGHKDPRCRFVFGGFVRLHEAAMADPESARLLVNCPSRPWPVSDHGHCDVATVVGAYGIATWWFAKIEFQPQGVVVFGSVGIVLLSWLVGLPKKLRRFRGKVSADQKRDKGENDDD